MKIISWHLALPAIFAFIVFNCSCARTETGGYLINASTIAKGITGGKLVVNEEAGGTNQQRPPAKPRSGCILVVGVLEAEWPYDCRNGKPYDSMASKRGWEFESGSGKPWFAAEIDEKSGEVVSAQLDYDAYVSRGISASGHLAAKLDGSYGSVTRSSWMFAVKGPYKTWDGHSIREDGSSDDPAPAGDQGAVMTGNGNLLSAKNGAVFQGKLYFNINYIPKKPPSKLNCDADITFGTVRLKVIR